MVTLGHTTNLSEFELHFRAVMGLPIAGIHLEHIGCSAVILSPEESTEPLNYNMLDALKEDHTRIRIFGKPEAHVAAAWASYSATARRAMTSTSSATRQSAWQRQYWEPTLAT